MARFCESCGNELSPTATFCSACGGKVNVASAPLATGSSGAAAQPAPVRQEKVMLEEAGVTVTSARFMVRGQTYAMNGITSVKATVRHPSKLWPILTILFGIFGIVTYAGMKTAFGVVVALGITALGILWLRSKRPTYAVRLTSASGETEAYLSPDGTLVDRIVSAINNAIVHRG